MASDDKSKWRRPSAAERAEQRVAAREGDPADASPADTSPAEVGEGRPAELVALDGGGSNGGNGNGGNGRSKPKLKKLRAALVIMGLVVLAGISWIFGIMMAVAQDLPALENRAQYLRAQNSVILDRKGERLATLTNNEGRILVPSEEISPTVKEAVVAIEDERFYNHRGVDYLGILRAVREDVLSGSAAQGASTITQQFVKNALVAQDSRTIFQKLREAALAYQLERNWSKDKIMTEYLNSVYFGEGAYGIEAAAQTFFGYTHEGCGDEGQSTCASQVLPHEAALLAAIISSPAAYSPRAEPENSKAQRDIVLAKMLEQGFITDPEYDEYLTRPLPPPAAISPPADDSEAPYFTSWLRQQLVDRYGPGEAFGGGLEVTSTLDLELQRAVEAAAVGKVSGVGLDTSVVVLDNETAGVLAMVGGSDYDGAPFNLATNGHRQPGSSWKPFTLVTALEAGHSTGEVFASAPKEFPFVAKVPKKSGKNKKVPDIFRPANYDDNYLGSASLASATTFSDNSVYAELGLAVGPSNVARTADSMGIDTDLETSFEYSIQGGPFEPYNPAMVLGGLEVGVTTLEMAHAYNTIAEDGNRVTGSMASNNGGPVAISKVEAENEDGDLELVKDKNESSGQNEAERKQVISPETAKTARSTLATVVSSGTGKRAQTGESTWGKTGTTDDNGDAWFCGATDDITACVWVGHADSVTPMTTEFGGAPVDGGTYPALIFADIVNAYLNTVGAETDAADSSSVAPDPVESAAPVAPTPAPEEGAPDEPAPEAAPTAPTPAAPTDEVGGGVVGRGRR